MRQRNTSGSVLHVSAWPTEQYPDHHPFDAGPGEEVDFPQLLAGFTLLDPPDGAEGDPADEPAGAVAADGAPVPAGPRPKPTRSSKNAAAAAGGSDTP